MGADQGQTGAGEGLHPNGERLIGRRAGWGRGAAQEVDQLAPPLIRPVGLPKWESEQPTSHSSHSGCWLFIEIVIWSDSWIAPSLN